MGGRLSTCESVSILSLICCVPVIAICLIVLPIVVTQMNCGFTLEEYKSSYNEAQGIVINNYTTTLQNAYQFYNVIMYNDNQICSLERYNGTNVTEGMSELLSNGHSCVIYHDKGSTCYTDNIVKNCKKERAISITIIILSIIAFFICVGFMGALR